MQMELLGLVDMTNSSEEIYIPDDVLEIIDMERLPQKYTWHSSIMYSEVDDADIPKIVHQWMESLSIVGERKWFGSKFIHMKDGTEVVCFHLLGSPGITVGGFFSQQNIDIPYGSSESEITQAIMAKLADTKKSSKEEEGSKDGSGNV